MEQNTERLRKEHKQEISQREEEVDEVRYSMEKKIKGINFFFLIKMKIANEVIA